MASQPTGSNLEVFGSQFYTRYLITSQTDTVNRVCFALQIPHRQVPSQFTLQPKRADSGEFFLLRSPIPAQSRASCLDEGFLFSFSFYAGAPVFLPVTIAVRTLFFRNGGKRIALSIN